MKYFFLLILIYIPVLLFASSENQYSTNCKNWRKISYEEAEQSGYLKNETGIIFFDYSKNLWIQLDSDPILYLEKNDDVFILSKSFIESHSLKIKYKDTLLKIMLTLAAIAKETVSEPRWTLRMKNGEGELSAMFIGSKKCSVEPEASALLCKKEKNCILGPNLQNPDKNVHLCAKELGLLDTHKLQGIARACEIISDKTTYENIMKSYNKASSACKLKISELPSSGQLNKICEDASILINSF